MDVICLCWASLHGNIEVVKFLISISANIHAKDRFGTTPLIVASESGYVEIVKILIGEGADINAKIDDAETTLMLTSRMEHTEIIKLLKDAVARK